MGLYSRAEYWLGRPMTFDERENLRFRFNLYIDSRKISSFEYIQENPVRADMYIIGILSGASIPDLNLALRSL